MLIMKTLCSLVVVVVAVAASPICLSFCDVYKYSGWKISRRSGCNCMNPNTKLQDGAIYKHDLKSILFPLKSQNFEPILNRHNNYDQDYDRISLTYKYFSGFGNNKPNEIKHNVKRTSDNGEIPLEIDNNYSKTSKSSKYVLNNMNISERNLSDCIDLYILINIRKHKIKNHNNLKSDVTKINNLNDLEINAEIKSKCNQAIEIMKKSVAEIKEHQLYRKKKIENVNVTPKLESRIASEDSDESIPVNYDNEDMSTVSTIKNTGNDEIYTNAIDTTITPTLTTETLNDYNISTTLNDNIRDTDKYNNLINLNDSIAVVSRDSTNTTDISPNVTVNPSTQLINTQTPTEIESNSFKFTDELVIDKSLNPVVIPEVDNKLTADNFDNVKESTSKTDQFITNNNNTLAIKTINAKENHTHRHRYKEKDIPIIRIITREYSNNTISSIINGTEILPNSDFEEGINNNKTENISDAKTFTSINESDNQSKSEDMTPAVSKEQTFGNTSPIINGRLYFVYEQKHIPGYFVQTPEGHLQLSLDLYPICNESTQQGKQDAVLIATLCEFLKQ